LKKHVLANPWHSKTFRRWFLITGICVLTLLICTAFLSGKEPDKYYVQSKLMMTVIRQEHFKPQNLNDVFSKKVFDLYIKELDVNKRFLLKADYEELKEFQTNIDNELRSGTFRFFEVASRLLKTRVFEAENIAQTILKEPFDYTIDESFETDPEKRDYPADTEELKEIWRKYLKYTTLMEYHHLLEMQKTEAEGKKDTPAELEAKARKNVAKRITRAHQRILRKSEQEHFEDFLDVVARSFDPHTEFMPPKEKEEFDISMTGRLEGIGAVLQEDGEFIKVVEIIPGSAAWRQKELQPEDRILKVAQGSDEPVDIVDMPVDEAVKYIRGKKGTEVRLTVRKPDGQIKVITLIRDTVIVEETYAKSAIISDQKLNRKFGYILLPSFYSDFTGNGGRNSADDVRKELQKLMNQNVDGIILDLRDNGGGSLVDAIDISGIFIGNGPVVQVLNRSGSIEVKEATNNKVTYKGPLVVLVNSLSASASEILAAALQDYGRAVIVGGQTYGKGTVQVIYDFDKIINERSFNEHKPLGSVKITIQKFYRINGGSTQEKGVEPDITLPDPYSYLEIGERKIDYAMPWDTIPAAKYKKWAGSLNLGALRNNSAKRIKEDPVFIAIDSYVQRAQERQKNTEKTLNLVAFMKEQKAISEETDHLEKIQTPQEHIKVVWTSETKNKEKVEKWTNELLKDRYIVEAGKIINDMIAIKP